VEVTKMIDENFVIDMEHHFIPSVALKLVGKTREHDFTIGLRRFRKAYETMADINIHLEFMDASGIDMSILSTGAFTPNGYNFCETCNDGYSEVIRRYPDRFKGMIQVYPYDEDKNWDEIKRGVEQLGLWGIALVSSYGEMTIDSPLMDPIYEIALKYEMPVFIHPTVRTNLWGGERYDLYTTVSREYDIAKSFVEIIYGVLPRFPELKVIMAHLGGGLPTLKWRLVTRYKVCF
jgi:aminocarboxymuconate-semialdehyde decarboxylase